jgi:hypothetical protein
MKKDLKYHSSISCYYYCALPTCFVRFNISGEFVALVNNLSKMIYSVIFSSLPLYFIQKLIPRPRVHNIITTKIQM